VGINALILTALELQRMDGNSARMALWPQYWPAPGLNASADPAQNELVPGVYGKVTVRVTMDRAGAVKDARVVQGHPMLREAAVNAAQQWKFEPGATQK